MATELVKRGAYISFSGSITRPTATQAGPAIRAVPADRILIETDSPYLSPEPMRGKRNQPKYVRYVIEKMAELKNISPEEMANINIENAKALFGVLGE